MSSYPGNKRWGEAVKERVVSVRPRMRKMMIKVVMVTITIAVAIY